MPTPAHTLTRRELPAQRLAARRQAEGPTHSSPAARHAAQLQSQLDASPRVQAIQRVVQRDDDDTGFFGNLFKKYVYGPHFYSVRHRANSPLEGESEADTTRRTYESLKKKPAPGNFGKGASSAGTPIWLFPFGKIFSQSNDEDSSVTNTTVPPHLLHPGWAKRKAIGSDIETTGGGHGLFPAANNFFANSLWGYQALKLRFQNDPKFKKQWDKQTFEEYRQLGLDRFD